MSGGRRVAAVVGSGPAGLTAAILLAQRGWQVTVFEQHYRAGGCLHRFFRKGVGFDTGFHYVGSADAGQSFGQVLRHLGVADRLSLRPMDPDGFDILRFPGLEFRVPRGVDRWAGRLGEAFPKEAAGVARYVAIHRECVAAYGLYSLDASVPPEAILPWESRSLRSVLEACFDDPRIQAVIAGHGAPLYGVGPSEAPFGLHAVVTDHFLGGASTIVGGGDRLAQVLAARLAELGGSVRLRSGVASILTEGGVAAGVGLESGESFAAELVVAAIHPKAVLAMLPAGAVRPAYRERVESARSGMGHIGAYLEVEGDLSLFCAANLYRYASWDVDAGGDLPFWFLTAPGARGEDAGVVLGLFPTEATRWETWAEDLGKRPGGSPKRPAAYEAEKGRLLELFLASVQAEFPTWKIRGAEASTPLTMAHYTRGPQGATYGHHHAIDQMGRYRLPMLTRVRGLVQVGQAVAMPGICGAMMSAYLGVGGMDGLGPLIEAVRSACRGTAG